MRRSLWIPLLGAKIVSPVVGRNVTGDYSPQNIEPFQKFLFNVGSIDGATETFFFPSQIQ
jgi:hypothetical protein